ncbi:MAG TPA: DUF5819 family protein [Roseiflexaceae bacterium]|nr:DUF5819 family protein [Roseiflexaceae bacterium]
MHHLRPLLHGAIYTLLAILVAAHFGITIGYLMPVNPITLQTAGAVDRYMNPLFAQDWHLFAPNPINDTRTLLISCRLRHADGSVEETAPADVSTPLWQAMARHRTSSAVWLSRLQAQAIQLYLYRDELLTRLEEHPEAQNPALSDLTASLRADQGRRQALATRLMARLGSAYCNRWYGQNQTVAIRVQLNILRFPRFSERHLPDTAGELRPYLFDWMPYEPVAPLSLLRN